ncbi:MAG TPA: hypothetical protein DCX54_05620 [Flavobacteriales bacterium]|nr:hypothetical protein [Flavobacteriales bacterium]
MKTGDSAIILSFIMLLICNSSIAQNSENRGINLRFGAGWAECVNTSGVVGCISVSKYFRNKKYTIRNLAFKSSMEGNPAKCKEWGLLVGKDFNSFSFSAGLSYSWGEKRGTIYQYAESGYQSLLGIPIPYSTPDMYTGIPFHTVGIPFELNLSFLQENTVYSGFCLFGNLNMEQPYVGFTLYLNFKMLSKTNNK